MVDPLGVVNFFANLSGVILCGFQNCVPRHKYSSRIKGNFQCSLAASFPALLHPPPMPCRTTARGEETPCPVPERGRVNRLFKKILAVSRDRIASCSGHVEGGHLLPINPHRVAAGGQIAERNLLSATQVSIEENGLLYPQHFYRFTGRREAFIRGALRAFVAFLGAEA